MPVSPDTISSTQKALCLYLLYLGTRPDKGGFRILDWGGVKNISSKVRKKNFTPPPCTLGRLCKNCSYVHFFFWIEIYETKKNPKYFFLSIFSVTPEKTWFFSHFWTLLIIFLKTFIKSKVFDWEQCFISFWESHIMV